MFAGHSPRRASTSGPAGGAGPPPSVPGVPGGVGYPNPYLPYPQAGHQGYDLHPR